MGNITHLVFGHGTHDEGANHAWEGSHTIGDAHEDTGIPGRNVQVVHIKP